LSERNRIHDNLRPGGHLYFDLITPCQPLGGRRAYIRRFGAAEGDADQEPELVAKGAGRSERDPPARRGGTPEPAPCPEGCAADKDIYRMALS
jgi:hypothetical protein